MCYLTTSMTLIRGVGVEARDQKCVCNVYKYLWSRSEWLQIVHAYVAKQYLLVFQFYQIEHLSLLFSFLLYRQ